MILKNIQVGPFETNCYLLGDETAGVCCVVDPGEAPERVLAMVEESGLTLQYILLTHAHWDHVGGIPGILEKYPDMPVYMHELEQFVPGGNPRFQYNGAMANRRFYDDGDVLPLGSLSIRVMHTPGHSRGSVVLQCGGVMLSGDTLFEGNCGRCDLIGGDLEQMFDSLKRLAEVEGDYAVYSGHGPGTTLDAERRQNPYMKQAMRR